MRLPTVLYAVERYQEIRKGLAPLLDVIGHHVLACIVHQHGVTEEHTWRCQEIGLDRETESFWAVFYERREDDPQKVKKITVVMDIDTISSIEFEVFDEEPSYDEEQEDGD